MDREFKVKGFFKTSIGTIVVIKLPNHDIILDHGMIFNNGHSRWKIIGIGMGKKPDFKDPESYWRLIMDYEIEHISGDGSLKECDLLFLE